MLLQVHRSGDSGSPRVTGSTNFSKSLSNVGSRAANVLRPPPGWRIRLREEGLTGTSGEPWSSRTPRRIVVMERPVASTTAESPPHGNSRASAAAQCRRKDSSMVGPRAWYFRRRLSMISGSLISRAERCEGNLSSYFCAGPKERECTPLHGKQEPHCTLTRQKLEGSRAGRDDLAAPLSRFFSPGQRLPCPVSFILNSRYPANVFNLKGRGAFSHPSGRSLIVRCGPFDSPTRKPASSRRDRE